MPQQTKMVIFGYVHTLPNSFSCQHKKLSSILWTATAHKRNKSFTEWLTKRVLFSKSQLFTLAQWISVLFPSYSLLLQSRHLFILHHSLVQNPSNMWWVPLSRMVSCSFTPFTTEIVGQTQHYVWKEALSRMIFVLVQWLSSAASVNIGVARSKCKRINTCFTC